MKKCLITLIIAIFGIVNMFAQPEADAGIGGAFLQTPIPVGGFTSLVVDFAADPTITMPTGEVEITLSFPANGVYINATDIIAGPTGTSAAQFDWSWNTVTKSWGGINNSPILGAIFGGGGTIIFEVEGVIDVMTETTLLLVQYANDPNPYNDNNEPSLVVPVEFSSFYVNSIECGEVEIAWTTESENENDKFLIERKIDKSDFETIGSVKGAGNSSSRLKYQYTDLVNFNEDLTLYYRLKQIDKDGRYEYTEIIEVNYTCVDILSVDIYPNPAVNSLNFEFNTINEQNVKLEVFDNLGKRILFIPHMNLDELNSTIVDISILTEGLYQVKITNGNTVLNKNIIKID